MGWEPPDWIVVPGGNLGNSSAFGKAFIELAHVGLIDRVPRLAVINAAGARTLEQLVGQHGLTWSNGLPDMSRAEAYYDALDAEHAKASTIASAIEINRPVNLKKCLRALDFCTGVVRQVSDQEIMDAKARVGSGGLGCEPASAASVAGAKRLREEGVIAPSDRVVCILTGHQLKDPTATVAYHGTDQENFEKVLGSRGVRRAGFANRPVVVANDLDDIIRTIALYSDAAPVLSESTTACGRVRARPPEANIMAIDSRRSMDVTVASIGFVASPGWPENLCCPRCTSPIPLHQPDCRIPERMLATCHRCRRWFLVELPPGCENGLLIELPPDGYFHDVLGIASATIRIASETAHAPAAKLAASNRLESPGWQHGPCFDRCQTPVDS
jgi:hypothetical protein